MVVFTPGAGGRKSTMHSTGKKVRENKQKGHKMPKHWSNMQRNDPDNYSNEKWKALSIVEQEDFINESRPKQHRFLSLCYPQRFPSNFPEAWDSLTDGGTTKAIKSGLGV